MQLKYLLVVTIFRLVNAFDRSQYLWFVSDSIKHFTKCMSINRLFLSFNHYNRKKENNNKNILNQNSERNTNTV